MIRDARGVEYTEEYEKGFTFRKLDKYSREKELKALRKKRNIKLLWMFALVILGIIMLGFISNDTIEIMTYIYEIIVVTSFSVYVLNDNTNIKTLKKDNVYVLDVEILELLPYEGDVSLGATGVNVTERYYPIVGRDVVSQYESVCYVSEKTYEKAKCGDIVTLQRWIRK